MILELVQKLLPFIIQIITTILPILIDLFGKILPPIIQLVEQVLPIFQQIFEAIMPLLNSLCETILPILMTLLEALSPIIQLLAELFSGALGEAIKSITTLLQPFFDILNGIITFIGGVFKGDWEKVWEGIVGIFKGILNGLMGLFESMVNGIFWIINSIFDGINWAIEWTGLEIPHIDDVHLPRFRAGIDFVPADKYLAYLDRGEAVLTADEADEYRQLKRENGTQSPFKLLTDNKHTEPKTVNQTFNVNVTVEKINDDNDIDRLAVLLSERLAEEVRTKEGVYA